MYRFLRKFQIRRL